VWYNIVLLLGIMMQKDFGFSGVFEVDTVLAAVGKDEESMFLEFTPIDSHIQGRFIIGEFTVTDSDDTGADMKFSVSFLKDDKDEEDALAIEYQAEIKNIVMTILNEMPTEEV
jgi:hypothetical protein